MTDRITQCLRNQTIMQTSRTLSQFKKKSIKYTLKGIRNDFLLQLYIKKRQSLNLSQNVENSTLVIIDNSTELDKRHQIKQICESSAIAYVSLPKSRTKHANRSHSMAMQWCYEHIVKPLQPEHFGFIDHDLIPLEPIDLKKTITGQAFYGVKWISNKTDAWQLWAGYCFFDFDKLKNIEMNFMYDFASGLDTGGRNFEQIYQYYNPDTLKFDNSFLNILKAINFLEKHPLSELETKDFSLVTRHVKKVSSR